MWKSQRASNADRLGDFLDRVGKEKIQAFCAAYVPGTAFDNPTVRLDKPPDSQVHSELST